VKSFNLISVAILSSIKIQLALNNEMPENRSFTFQINLFYCDFSLLSVIQLKHLGNVSIYLL